MIPEKFYEMTIFNKTNQLAYLNNPTPEIVRRAIHTTTHHLIIEGDDSFEKMFVRHGWTIGPKPYLNNNQYHYINFKRMPTNINEMFGWYDFESLHQDIVNNIEESIICVEIGTYHAKSSIGLGSMIKKAGKTSTIFTIDDYQPYNYGINIQSNFSRNVNVIRHFGLSDYIIPMVGDSHVLHHYFQDESLDFVFIDGDHTFKSVDYDINLWLPKVKHGCIISGHDYSQHHPGVIKAVDKNFKKDNIKLYGNSAWAVTKP